MKHVFSLVFSILLTSALPAQLKVISLHPLIGDTIDQKEKSRFFLFPEIADSDFCWGEIICSNEGYSLQYNTGSCSMTNKQDSLAIEQYKINIKKLISYYESLSNSDSAKISIKDFNTTVSPIKINIISSGMMEKLPYESRRYEYLNGEAERMGLWGDEKEDYIKKSGYLEIFNSDK